MVGIAALTLLGELKLLAHSMWSALGLGAKGAVGCVGCMIRCEDLERKALLRGCFDLPKRVERNTLAGGNFPT